MFRRFSWKFYLNSCVMIIIALCVVQDNAGVVSRNFKAGHLLSKDTAARNKIKSDSNPGNQPNNVAVIESSSLSNSSEPEIMNMSENVSNHSDSSNSAESKKPDIKEKVSTDTSSEASAEVTNQNNFNSNSNDSSQGEKPNANLIKKNSIKSSVLSEAKKQKEESKNKAIELKKQFQVGQEPVQISESPVQEPVKQSRAKMPFNYSIIEALNRKPVKDFYLSSETVKSLNEFSKETESDTKDLFPSKPVKIASELNKQFFEEKISQMENSDIYQDIIDENDLEHVNLTNTLILPINVVDFVEEEELVSFSPNALLNNSESINGEDSENNKISKGNEKINNFTKQVTFDHKEKSANSSKNKTLTTHSVNRDSVGFAMKLPENTRHDGVNLLETIPQQDKDLFGLPVNTKNNGDSVGFTMKLPENTKHDGVNIFETISQQDMNLFGLTENTKNGDDPMGFTMKLPENTKHNGVNFLGTIPQQDKDLFGFENKSSSFITVTKPLKEVSIDSTASQLADGSGIGFESAVSSGLDFLMNTEVAKNAAAAIDVFNFSDPSLSDHIIESADIHSFIDMSKPSLQENSSDGGTKSQSPSIQTSDSKKKLNNDSSPTKIGPKNTHVQVKPVLSILQNTIGVDVNVNVTRLTSAVKDCPPPGVCLFWFSSHDQCKHDDECPNKMKCCKVRCTNECIEV